jgi:hypothetical protein
MILPNGEPLRWDQPGAKWDGTVEELNLSTPNRPMQQNDIDITITTDAEALVHTKAAELRAAILAAGGRTLTDDERARYFKLGDARLPFHAKSNNHMHQRADLVPPTVDVPKYDKDEGSNQAAQRMLASVAGAIAPLTDMAIILGSDLLSADLAFYYYLPLAIRAKTPGAEAVYDDLKESWPGRGPGPKPPKPNP